MRSPPHRGAERFWLVLSLGLFCHPAVAQTTTQDYIDLVLRYRQGEFLGAARALSRMPQDEIEAASAVYRQRRLSEAEVKAVVLLHTEAVLLRDDESASHLREALAWMRKLASPGGRSFERLWYLTLSYFYLSAPQQDDRPALEAAVKAFPDDVEIRLAAGTFYETVGWMARDDKLLKSAEAQFRLILRKEPESAEARVRLGRVLYLTGHEQEARVELKRGLDLAEEAELRLSALLTLGDIHRKHGEIPEALQSYRIAKALDPMCQTAAIALAQGLHDAGDSPGSLEVIEDFFVEQSAAAARSRGMSEENDLWWRYMLGHSDRFESLLDRLREEVHK